MACAGAAPPLRLRLCSGNVAALDRIIPPKYGKLLWITSEEVWFQMKAEVGRVESSCECGMKQPTHVRACAPQLHVVEHS